MQASYAPSFARDMGCTAAEFIGWLPGASAGANVVLGESQASIGIEAGELRLRWQVLAPRQIALIRLPRLLVQFEFHGVSDAARERFMRHFDRFTQRGGG